MNSRTWSRHHVRLTVLIVQTGPTHFHIPLEYPSGTAIPVDGSLEDAQRMADAVSGCEDLCGCPAWVDAANQDAPSLPAIEIPEPVPFVRPVE